MYNILGYSLVIWSFYDAFQPLGLHGGLPGWADGQAKDEADVQHHHAQGGNITFLLSFDNFKICRMTRMDQLHR